ncbi:MAG: PAS-domain containing protein [Magnetococcales bacterium]|nr:PAS-domain containing protein [Magnetococcales bacterium]
MKNNPPKNEGVENSTSRPSFQKMSSASPKGSLGHWEWNIQQDKLIWSAEVWEIYGLKRGEFEPSYETMLNRVHPGDRAHYIETVKASLEGSPHHFKYRILRPDGICCILETQGTVMLNKHNKPIRIIGTVQDVTEEERGIVADQVITRITYISLKNMPMKEMLAEILEVIFRIPWISLESKGSIFLVSPDSRELSLVAQKGLAGPLLERCEKIPFGHCLCGKAAESREVVFADHLDHRHDVTFEGIHDHGHYCVPILLQERLLGVLNLYTEAGHMRRGEEDAFLVTVANTLAGLIDRLNTEHKLSRQSILLKTALANIHQGLVAYDGDLRVIIANERFSELRDIPEELVRPGTHFSDLIRYEVARGEFGPGDQETLVNKLVEQAKHSKVHRFERIRRDGTVLEIAGGPLPGGGFVSTYMDISQRRQSEEELRKLSRVVEQSPVAVLITCPQGEIEYVNPEFTNITGYTLAEVASKNPRILASGNTDPELYKDLWNTILRGRIWTGEFQNRKKNGELYWESISISPLTNAKGEITHFVAIWEDITARKQTQAERDEAYGMLEVLSIKLSKYLSPQVYQSIFSGERDVTLSTERKKLTVFFSDIKDFTATTDDLEPEDLTFLLNDYLTEMSNIAITYGATIDKFIGDAMLMFFGDPETRGAKEDAIACVGMAIAMQKKMQDLRSKWQSMGYEQTFHMRIGINTGYCNVGNFGSQDRMDYTIIGGEVNLAARLEDKAEPDGIMMTYETYALAREMVHAEEQPTIKVKGIHRPVRPFSVVGLYRDLARNQRYVHLEKKGLLVMMDLATLKDEERQEALAELEQAIQDIRKRE